MEPEITYKWIFLQRPRNHHYSPQQYLRYSSGAQRRWPPAASRGGTLSLLSGPGRVSDVGWLASSGDHYTAAPVMIWLYINIWDYPEHSYPINHPNHLHHLILTESKHIPGIILTEGLHKLSISKLIMLDVCFSANKRTR